jgi:hypothetical protein
MNPPPLSYLNRISNLKPPHDPCFHNLNGYVKAGHDILALGHFW